MNENITKNEIFNDGKTIHLYYNGMIGLYVSYGISAFLLYKYAKAKPSYSDDMQMPVAVINAEHYETLKEKLGLSKTFKNYRCLKVEIACDENEYSNWASELRMGGGQFRNVNCVELIAKSFGKKVAVGFCFVH